MCPSRLSVDSLTRVEGEGGIEIDLDEQRRPLDVRINIFEPPRFFEGIVRGRRCEEIADLVARICGLCPVTYQLGTLMALERILGVTASRQVRLLRKVFILSQYLGSHGVHVFFLALPDYLGYHNIFELAGEHRDLVNRGLRLKKIGNDIASLLGAREIHPVTAVIGGFTKLPPRRLLDDLIVQLRGRQDDALAALEQIAALRRPAWAGGRIYGALYHPEEYAVDEGVWRTSSGLSLSADEFTDHVEEYQVPYSNALRCRLAGGAYYMVGPLARVSLNFEQLAPETLRAASRLNLSFPDYNPFDSIVARLLEIMHAIEMSIKYLEAVPVSGESLSYDIKAGAAASLVEAPRGTLYHRFRIDDRGLVQEARIIPPTTQNLSRIEQDLREMAPQISCLPDEELARACEVAVRNYDPCISCATHCLVTTRS
ncbi:MAG: Ni/Fe hydrogenase subunit alpha [Thermacetogeniaceae bacterium]